MKKTVCLILVFLFALSHSYAQREKIDSLLHIINSAEDTAKKNAYFYLGKYYINISIDSSAAYLLKALELAKTQKDKVTEANSYSLLGVSEKNMGNYDKAITYHLMSLKINEEMNNEHNMAISYNDLGVLYRIINRHDEALKYYRRSNELCRKINLSKGISMTYNNIGIIMKMRNMSDSAVYYYQRALNTAEETGDTYSISTCLTNIGESYIIDKRYNDALAIFKRCLQYDKQNEDKPGIVSSYLEIARSLQHLRSFPLAIKYADSAHTLSLQEHLTNMMPDILLQQADIYKAMGDNRTALAIMEKYIATRDTLMDRETSEHIAEYQTKYETEKKEKEITTLKQLKEIDDLVIQKTRYQMLAIIGVVLVLATGAYLLYSRQQVNQKIARQKAVLAAEYNERLRIAKDVHDDLGSGLSKISLMADMAQRRAAVSLKSGDDIRYIGADIRHIAAVSKELVDNMRDLIWVLNPENTTLDNLVARLREYCADYLDGMEVAFTLNFPDHIPDMRISRESQRNIFSTVKESINNCVKHAAATEIIITLLLTDNKFNITVRDNGRGFDVVQIKGSGNGLRNMKQRIEAIDGTFTIISAAGNGTEILITVALDKLDLLKNTTIV